MNDYSKGASEALMLTAQMSATISTKSVSYGDGFMKAICMWVDFLEEGIEPDFSELFPETKPN